MIAVCIVTYNQESFVAQTIESVQAQVCDEPVRIYIGDDASTDGTRAICERYAAEDERIVYVRRPKNIGLAQNTLDLYRLMMADGCTYIAMLDGDDYWTDPNKLQLQTDYLRAHPETGLVHTAAYEETDGKRMATDEPDKPTGDIRTQYNLSGARHTNCTVLFRSDLLKEIPLDELERQHFPIVDYPLYGLFAQHTCFGYLYHYTAAWRNHSSVSRPVRWKDYIRYKTERVRMWKWLDTCYPHRFHYSGLHAIWWLSRQVFAFFYEKMK